MSYLSENATTTAIHRKEGSINRILEPLHKIIYRTKKNAEIKKLMELSDEMLRDIGLTRNDIFFAIHCADDPEAFLANKAKRKHSDRTK